MSYAVVIAEAFLLSQTVFLRSALIGYTYVNLLVTTVLIG